MVFLNKLHDVDRPHLCSLSADRNLVFWPCMLGGFDGIRDSQAKHVILLQALMYVAVVLKQGLVHIFLTRRRIFSWVLADGIQKTEMRPEDIYLWSWLAIYYFA